MNMSEERSKEHKASSETKTITLTFEEYVVGDEDEIIRIPKADSLKRELTRILNMILKEIENYNNKLYRLQIDLSNITKSINELHTYSKNLRKFSDLESQVRLLGNRVIRIEEELQKLRRDLALKFNKIGKVLRYFHEKINEITSLDTKMTELKRLRDIFNDVKKKLENLMLQLRELTQELAQTKTSTISLSQRLEDIEKQLEELSKQVIRQDTEIRSIKNTIDMNTILFHQVVNRFLRLAQELNMLSKKQLIMKKLNAEKLAEKLKHIREMPPLEKIRVLKKMIKSMQDEKEK